jgi:membrane-associated phospholipid phosphatase
MKQACLAILLLVAAPLYAADSVPKRAVKAIQRELFRYRDDAESLATAPLHWEAPQWQRFGEGMAVVAAFYATDRASYDAVQRNRSQFTNEFAKHITPFGGGRATQLSVLLIAAGAGMHDTNLRDAGRDALESELWAAGIVTPVLKRTFGRTRPSQGEGAHSFHPLNGSAESFPSGHATNAFALATAVAGHYDGWLVPTIVYGMAAGVAFSRVNDRAHFPSDVVAGALIGHAAARGIVARHGKTGKHSWMLVPVVAPRTAGLLFKFTGSR